MDDGQDDSWLVTGTDETMSKLCIFLMLPLYVSLEQLFLFCVVFMIWLGLSTKKTLG